MKIPPAQRKRLELTASCSDDGADVTALLCAYDSLLADREALVAALRSIAFVNVSERGSSNAARIMQREAVEAWSKYNAKLD